MGSCEAKPAWAFGSIRLLSTFIAGPTHATRRLEPLEDLPGPPGHNVAAIDLHKLMKRCCPSHQELLQRHLQGQTTTEMAQEMGASEGAMRIRLMKARRALRAAA